MADREIFSPWACLGSAGNAQERRTGINPGLAFLTESSLVVDMIVARILQPASKLATARSLQEETATTSLGLELRLGQDRIDEQELYGALDWLLERQTRIENKLAGKHLSEGMLILYDVTSSYYTGHRSELVQFGYNRDGKRGFPQIVYGLLCNAEVF